ncbi:MAG: hypothetical protein LEGION0403_FIIPPAGN_02053 [Legionella sp.]|uniref:hypothetical protein n=1 Tax=Legionella sp. TaxID=459 RepID=UPI003D1414D3
MLDFINITNYVSEIECPFEGLPYAIALLVKILVLDAEPNTGLVKNISYSQLAKKLYIKPAPGRSNSGIPTKQTIRNYINVLERDFPEYFINVSQGQKLVSA